MRESQGKEHREGMPRLASSKVPSQDRGCPVRDTHPVLVGAGAEPGRPRRDSAVRAIRLPGWRPRFLGPLSLAVKMGRVSTPPSQGGRKDEIIITLRTVPDTEWVQLAV